MKIFNLEHIKSKINLEEAIELQEKGFQLYSKGKVSVPPVTYLNLGGDKAEVHIKNGWIIGDSVFVVKVAGSFYNNPIKHHISSMQGGILIFCANTGVPLSFLNDEGYLTNLRTAIAGCIAAKYLAPKSISSIGILGTGIQAYLQAKLLLNQVPCRKLCLWGRNEEKAKSLASNLSSLGYQVEVVRSAQTVSQKCNLIVTTTSSKSPLLYRKDIQPGTHITAVGADAPKKQELDPYIFEDADLCTVDSRSQCLDHGETSHAYRSGIISKDRCIELGELIASPSLRRRSDSQISITDLTGVAVQDIQIAKSISN